MKSYKAYIYRYCLVASQLVLFYIISKEDYSGRFLTIFSLNGLLSIVLYYSSAKSLEKSDCNRINIYISIFEIISAIILAIYTIIYFGFIGITSLFIIFIAPLETYLKGFNKQHLVYLVYTLINLGCLLLVYNEFVIIYFFGLKLFALFLLNLRLKIIAQITKKYEIQRLYINRQNIINHLIGLELSFIPKGLIYKIYTSFGNMVSVYFNVRNFENYNKGENPKSKSNTRIFLNSISLIIVFFSLKHPILYPLILLIQSFVSYIAWNDFRIKSLRIRNILILLLVIISLLSNLNLVIGILAAEIIYELWTIKK